MLEFVSRLRGFSNEENKAEGRSLLLLFTGEHGYSADCRIVYV